MPASATDVNKHLETLGLKPEDLNGDAVRVAYKKLALRWHPDRHNADPEEAKEKFIEVNDAYKALVEECKKRDKRKKSHKEEDGASTWRPFWAGSAPSASSSSSSSSSNASSSRGSRASDSSAKHTEMPPAKPKETHAAKPGEARSNHSSDSSSAKPSHTHADKHTDATHKHEARPSTRSRQSGDRDTSHSSPKAERSQTKSSHAPSAAPKSPRPFKTVHLDDSDSDSSLEDGSLPANKHRHYHRGKGKKPSLGEDDYEFIDLGAPLKPIRSPKAVSNPAKDWIFPLHLSLEDLYFGATHRYRITRNLRSSPADTCSGKSTSKSQTVQIDLQVSPGWRTGTRIRVQGVGNQRRDGSFQDIVFVIAEAPHARFTRDGDHLVLPVRIPWVDAHSRPCQPGDADDDDSLLGPADGPGGHKFGLGKFRHHGHGHAHDQAVADEVYVMGLDGEEYTLPIPQTLVEAAKGTRIFGAGMPIRKDGKVIGKGDLVIRWEFVFPESDTTQRSRWQTLKDAMHLRFQV
ncbi:DnaJ-domain-containing protein [Dichomitus squalens]|uniref:DnaJ-domain-containing protein n=1 Tax=Dichomitus squalens TaxID=114155 RepID=A0A4Q9N2Q7_9APHY|nr:DnaJ-domain-containing protein [Dichomitus squalens]